MESPRIRSDFQQLRAANRESRAEDRLAAHFVIERELAGRLRASSQAERASLYSELYTELFARVADHPQNWADPAKRERNTANQVRFLKPFLSPDTVLLELGCGDAAVSKALAPSIASAIGVDVTPALMDRVSPPPNFRFVQTDGVTLDLPDASVSLAYSNQLMEHLHVDDAETQLREIRRVLRPGGRYLCATPNRVTGPHDISGYFGYEAVGFHMREYDHGSLAAMFRAAGFGSVRALVALKGRSFTLPAWPLAVGEGVASALPRSLRARLAKLGPVRSLAGLTLIGQA